MISNISRCNIDVNDSSGVYFSFYHVEAEVPICAFWDPSFIAIAIWLRIIFALKENNDLTEILRNQFGHTGIGFH